MTPAPARRHQAISIDLAAQFRVFLRGKKCRVYAAAFDVRLPAPGETDETTSTVVQPDLGVVCDPTKLDDRGCKGAPDLLIESISPDSAGQGSVGEAPPLRAGWCSGILDCAPWGQDRARFTVGVQDGLYGKPSLFTLRGACPRRYPAGIGDRPVDGVGRDLDLLNAGIDATGLLGVSHALRAYVTGWRPDAGYALLLSARMARIGSRISSDRSFARKRCSSRISSPTSGMP